MVALPLFPTSVTEIYTYIPIQTYHQNPSASCDFATQVPYAVPHIWGW